MRTSIRVAHNLSRMARGISSALGRFAREEWGVETAEVVLVVPLLIGVVWSALEIWQIMSLRTAMRSAVSQAARYVTAYSVPAANWPYDPGQVAWGVEKIIEDTLSRRRGIMGDALEWDIVLHRVDDPRFGTWRGNTFGFSEAELIYFLTDLQCTDQFGLELIVRVPWRTVLFGVKGVTDKEYTLQLRDTAVGAVHCVPKPGEGFYDFNADSDITVEDPDGGECRAIICWQFRLVDAEPPPTYLPRDVWVVDEGTGILLDTPPGMPFPWRAVGDVVLSGCGTVIVPAGVTDVTIIAGQFDPLYPVSSCGEYKVSASIRCGEPEPTETPVPPGL